MQRILLWVGLLGLTTSLAQAQVQRAPDRPFAGSNPFNHNSDKEFLQTQWWLGFKGGVNLSQPQLIQSHYVFSPIDYGPDRNQATYAEWNMPAMHLGLDITFYHKGLSVGFQPNYRQQRYSYQTVLEWQGDTEAERLQLTYDQENSVDYIDLPLFVKVDILGKKVRPFLMAGGYYSFRIDGNKTLEVSGLDEASGGQVALNGETIRVNIAQLYAPYVYGVLGGAGLSFDFWNVRLVLDATYRYGLANITNRAERFTVNQLVSLGEVPDDLSLNNLSFSMTLDFPLRYISNAYSPF